MRLFKECGSIFFRALFIVLLVILSLTTFAQKKSVKDKFPLFDILESNCPSKGFFFISSDTLISPEDQHYIAIVDNKGTPVFYRVLAEKANNFSLQPNGYLAYSSNAEKKIFVLDSGYHNIDTVTCVGYDLNDADFILGANNKSYVLGYDNRYYDMSSLVAGGNSNALIKEIILQVLDQSKNVVFTWKSKDHFNIMDVNENTPSLDLTSPVIDYINITDIEIDSDTTMLLCCRNMDEITKINLKTGEIIWRLGGKHNQFDFEEINQKFSLPTTVQKLSNGHLLIFDSGNLNASTVSSAAEYELNETAKTIRLVGRYATEKNIFTPKNGGAQGLINGNKVISWGLSQPSVIELNPNGTTALSMDFSNNSSSKRILKSNWRTNIFTPVVDSINFGMWDYTVFRYLLVLKNNSDQTVSITDLSNSSEAFYFEVSLPLQIPPKGVKNITICYYPETISTSFINDLLTISSENDSQRVAQQVKLVGYRDDFINPTLEPTPSNGIVNVDVDAILRLKFNEPIRLPNNSEINYNNVHSLVVLKKGADDVEFDAAISSNRDAITIIPKQNLEYSQSYSFGLNTDVEDYYDNVLSSSKVSSFTTKSSSQINNNPVDLGISIYPNPVSERLNIQSNLSLISRIELYNIQGELVASYSDCNHYLAQVNTNSLSDGLYLLKVFLKNGRSQTFKVRHYSTK